MSFVVETIEAVGDFVGDVVEEVGDVVEDVGKAVGNVVETVAKNPEILIIAVAAPQLLPTIGITGAAIAPVTAGLISASQGGDLEDIGKAALAAYVAPQVAGRVGGAVATAAEGSSLQNTLASTVGSAAGGAAAAAITGGDVGQSALLSGAGGAGGAIARDVATSLQYGTTPFSEQTASLISQDVGLNPITEAAVRLGTAGGRIAGGADAAQELTNVTQRAIEDEIANIIASGGSGTTTKPNGGGEITDQMAITYPGGFNFGGEATQVAQVFDQQTATDVFADRFEITDEGVVDRNTGKVVKTIDEIKKESEAGGLAFFEELPDGTFRDKFTGVIFRRDVDVGAPSMGYGKNGEIDSRERPITSVLDMRKFGGDENSPYEALIGGGGYSQAEGGVLPISLFGVDQTTGEEKYFIFDKVYTLITLPNGDKALQSDTTNQIFYPTITDTGNLKLTETTQGDINSGTFKPITGNESGGGGGGGGGGDAEAQAGGFYGASTAEQKQIEKFLDEIERSQSEAETAKARQQFITSQKDRLSGRLSGDLRSAMDAEIAMLISQYEKAKDAAERGRTAITDITGDERTKELIGILGGDKGGGTGGTGGGSGTGTGTGIGAGSGTGTGGGSGSGTGTGIGSGTGSGMGDGSGGGIGGGVGTGTGEGSTVIQPALTGETSGVTDITRTVSPNTITREPISISSRVTGEALSGLLRPKEPLFGGDEDAQRAVWNRRSLRLRRALGL